MIFVVIVLGLAGTFFLDFTIDFAIFGKNETESDSVYLMGKILDLRRLTW